MLLAEEPGLHAAHGVADDGAEVFDAEADGEQAVGGEGEHGGAVEDEGRLARGVADGCVVQAQFGEDLAGVEADVAVVSVGSVRRRSVAAAAAARAVVVRRRVGTKAAVIVLSAGKRAWVHHAAVAGWPSLPEIKKNQVRVLYITNVLNESASH
ncbi:MAG: hypothetical protein NVS2B11_04060 [Acetobacteraceae bacterium]